MTYYLDTSAIVPLILPDAHTRKAESWFDQTEPDSFVSSFARVEFAAVVSRRVRSEHLSPTQGRDALAIFEEWLTRTASLVKTTSHDIEIADRIVRDFDTKLSAPDAIHPAVARRLGAVLITFDQRLAAAAQLQTVRTILLK
jgi:predicted nucleic acid-binding protein